MSKDECTFIAFIPCIGIRSLPERLRERLPDFERDLERDRERETDREPDRDRDPERDLDREPDFSSPDFARFFCRLRTLPSSLLLPDSLVDMVAFETIFKRCLADNLFE